MPKNFTKIYKFWIKTLVFTQKCAFGPEKKNCTFYTINVIFAKEFHKNVQILDKNCSFVPKNVHLVLKNQKICTFYTKNEVFAKKISLKCTIFFYKNWSFVLKNVHLDPKKKFTFYTKNEVFAKKFP